MALRRREPQGNSQNRQGNQFILTPQFSSSGIGFNVFSPEAERAKQEIKQSFPSVSEKKQMGEDKQVANRIERLVNVFDRAYPIVREQSTVNKVRQFMPQNVQDDAYWRRLEGAEANTRAKLGFYDEPKGQEPSLADVKLYDDLSEGFITTLARRAGEQRVSDQDAKRFRRSLMNFGDEQRINDGKKAAMLEDANTLSPGQFLSKYTGNPDYQKNEKNPQGTVMQVLNQPETAQLPPGITEEQMQFTMKKHNMTRDQVLERLNASR